MKINFQGALKEYNQATQLALKVLILEHSGRNFLFVANYWSVNGKHNKEGMKNYIRDNWERIIVERISRNKSKYVRHYEKLRGNEAVESLYSDALDTLKYLDKYAINQIFRIEL